MGFLTQATDELEPDRCLLQPLDSGFGILPKNKKGIKIVNTAVLETQKYEEDATNENKQAKPEYL